MVRVRHTVHGSFRVRHCVVGLRVQQLGLLPVMVIEFGTTVCDGGPQPCQIQLTTALQLQCINNILNIRLGTKNYSMLSAAALLYSLGTVKSIYTV